MRFVIFFILVLKNLFCSNREIGRTKGIQSSFMLCCVCAINVDVNYLLPWLVIVRKHPFSVRFVALLFPIELRVGKTSRIAFNAPIRGSDTFFKCGKLFFSAYRWLTSRRLRKKPPSGNSTIHCRSRGINELRMWSRKRSTVASRCFRPCKSIIDCIKY